MVYLDPKEDYQHALVQYTQAQEILELARCHRNQALYALIESDLSLRGALELAVKDESFYERLKSLVSEYIGRRLGDAS
jgi:hypothetical protein